MKGGLTMSDLHTTIKEDLGDHYQPSDDQLINLYCETHAFYKRMQAELDKTSLLMPHTNKAGAENLVKNPLAIEITKNVQVLNNLLKSLGLTAAQRKAVAGTGEKDDSFSSF